MTQPRMRFDRDEPMAPALPPPCATADVPVRDTHVLAPTEQRRLSGQAAAILERLQAGPASRRELADICLNPTARVSDLRAAGYRIEVDEHPGGRSLYRLVAA